MWLAERFKIGALARGGGEEDVCVCVCVCWVRLQRRDLVMWLAEGFKIGALARGGGEEDVCVCVCVLGKVTAQRPGHVAG